jgi:hypothetical protein
MSGHDERARRKEGEMGRCGWMVVGVALLGLAAAGCQGIQQADADRYVDHGPVLIGHSSAGIARWKNDTGDPAEFTCALYKNPSGFYSLGAGAGARVIPNGGKYEVGVIFAPKDVGEFAAKVRSYCKTVNPKGSRGFKGSASRHTGKGVAMVPGDQSMYIAGGDAKVDSAIDFGQVVEKTAAKPNKKIEIVNNKAGNVRVAVKWLKGGQPFATVPAGPVITLKPGKNTIEITFTPPKVGKYADSVLFIPDGGTSRVGVSVKGEGIKAE